MQFASPCLHDPVTMYSEDQPLTTTPLRPPPPSPSPPRLAHLDPALLIQIAIFNIGSHYNQHVLSSLSSNILSTFNATRLAYGALFSSEELATVILCVVGLLLVYTPLPPTAFALTICVMLSTILTALSVSPFVSYTLLIVSRFVFGFTQGLLTTVQAAILAHQFPHRTGTAFGVMLLTSRLSSFAGLTMPAMFAASFGLQFSLWFAVSIAIPPVISAGYFFVTSSSRRTMYRRRRSVSVSAYSPIVGDLADSTNSTFSEMQTDQSHGSQLNPVSEMLTRVLPNGLASLWNTFVADMRNAFPLAFWLCCFIWIVFSGVVFTTLHFSVDILAPHFNISASLASFVSSTLMLVAGLSSPFVGTIQDKMRNRPRVLLYCSVILMCGCISFMVGLLQAKHQALSTICIILAFTLFTIGFSAGPVTLLSCIALIVPANTLPFGLAVYKSAESAGLAILHAAFGSLRDISNNYSLSLAMLAFLSAVGIIASSVLGSRMPAYKHDTLSINVSTS